ncbi:ribonuclease H-like domain-containing protein [Tanacetum coccineum]
MSEAEPIPPTSSVTALRIPMIKKGEYDLWSMKMRQYIAITDHILWDIITNGDQATTDPASSSVPKTSLAANARRNNEKALNILLSAIPDRHLLSFHDATNAKTLWTAIKARFGGNDASKKMQKVYNTNRLINLCVLLKEELDSAYERFQNILSMLELYDAKVSIEDANLKFLRSLPSVWHVVATMIRGQPGLDELEFDDLYNNLKVYEHELKGVSNSNSQNIAFLSTEVKGSTLKQSTAEPAHIPKGYTQAISSKVPTAPNCASHSDEIICSFFAQQASMPTTHDDEDLLQIDEDAMEEIDIRWQVAMITARIRKFMRKTGRPIDLKPKNGITFDKSKIECFNCQKLGHFARECRFAKYQENRANGRNEKRIVAIEDSNSKALVATDNNEDIDWTKEFDAEPVTYAMMALTGVEQDDWSIEFDAEHMHFGQDGLDDFDWSNKADDAPLALMATKLRVVAHGRSTGDKDKLSDFKEFKGGYVAFGNDPKGGRITGKGTIKTSCIDFEKVSYVEELKFNLLSVSQIYDKKHNIQLSKFDAIQKLSDMNSTTAKENQKGKGPDWMFDLELLTPSMNYIPVRKENYADSGGKVSTYDDVEDLDDQQFIVHGPSINAAQNKHSEERTADKEVPLSSEEQALHDELVSLMHQESIAKVHNDAQRNAFEEEKRRIALEKGKESANSTLTLSTANTPSQSTDDDHMRNLSDSDDDVPKDGVFSTNSFDDENTDNEEDGAPDYNNMDHTIDVSSTPTLRIHKNHPQSQIIGKSFEDPAHPNKVYRVSKHFMAYISPKSIGEDLKNYAKGIQEDSMGEPLFIFWGFKSSKLLLPASTPIEAHKSLGKDEEGEDVDVHLYRSMIGYLMYLTASRPDIMLCLSVCKHFSDSRLSWDIHDRRSTSGGCQYLGGRLVSWQCKKQTIMAISSIEAEYLQLQVLSQGTLVMQNQYANMEFNFLNTEIHIDNESTICIVKNPVLHSKTKHISDSHQII